MHQNTKTMPIHLIEGEKHRAPLGMPALFEELSSQGICSEFLLKEAGLWRGDIDLSLTELSIEKRLALFRVINHLAKQPDTALRAGKRQQISNFGVYGFALATNRTLGEAVEFGLNHIDLAGSVVPINFETENNVGIFRSINPRALGDVLPFAAEFWRSSISALLSHVLGAPFPTLAMYFPYPPPSYSRAYQAAFDCPVYFNSGHMEWHFDAAVLSKPCVNADQITAGICQKFCERILAGASEQTHLQRQIKNLCLGRPVSGLRATDAAQTLGMSLRTLHRRLASEGVTFQVLIDDTRKSIALEYLQNTNLSIAEIGFRCGFSDVSNFRKAFKKWSGQTASSVRMHAN